jgi:2-phospho-L-lactate guanylyltransferase
MTDILIPIKTLDLAKTRLSNVLDPSERAGLVLAMLRDLLTVLGQCPVDDVWVISADEIVLKLACEFGAKTIREEKSKGYNAAVSAGLLEIGSGAQVAVLPGDIPLASRADLVKLTSPSVAGVFEIRIVPDAAADGTNGLFQSSTDLIAPSFGASSFSRHKRIALESGRRLTVMRLSSLASDIDCACDLQAFIQTKHVGSTLAFLRDIGLPQSLKAHSERSVA